MAELESGCPWVMCEVCCIGCCGLQVNSPLSFQFIVYEVPGQDLEVDLYDEDPDRDDFLGR